MTKHPLYRLEIEALPSTNGTVISRLKRCLKVLAWCRPHVRSIEELPARTIPDHEEATIGQPARYAGCFDLGAAGDYVPLTGRCRA
jgi:hypothetical protein